MSSRVALSDFLASIERRAFRQAQFALRNEDAALDAVQEAMMRLASKYSHKPEEEWPMLFQRILQNAIRDSQRRSRVRNMWTSLLSSFGGTDEDESEVLERLSLADDSRQRDTPHGEFEQTQSLAIIEAEIAKLPARQREAFMLRYWEEFNIAETAEVMGCSEGSVKTHCSRATQTLAAALRVKGITL